MIWTRRERGFNVLASILLLISIFLVIGFGLGALATMNLNLSGRSIKVTQANNLAMAAATQIIYYVEKKTRQIIEENGFDLQNLSYIDLELEKNYGVSKNVFETRPVYMDAESTVNIHFTKQGVNDYNYSTDNSNNPESRAGARGMVPPFTIDLIVEVNIGGWQQHYQMLLNRKWDYVISCENGPVHLLSGVNTTGSGAVFVYPSQIEGEIFSGLNPLSPPRPSPAQISAYEILVNGYATRDYLYVNNRIPVPPTTAYPACLFVGANVTRTIENSGTTTSTNLGLSTKNVLNGRGCYPYKEPTNSPPFDKFIYTDNNADKVKFSRFNAHINSPFQHLKLISADDADKSHWINDKNYPGKVIPLTILKDKSLGADIKNMNFNDITAAEGPAPYVDQGDQVPEFEKRRAELEKAYGPDNQREVFMLMDSLDVHENVPLSEKPGTWAWNNSHKYIIRGEDGSYRPLVDEGVVASYSAGEGGFADAGEIGGSRWHPGEPWAVNGNHYALTNSRTEYVTSGKCVNFDNAILMSEDNLELSHTSLKGNNALLQARGDLTMKEGSITSGLDIGMVIYCQNFYLGGSGTFGGLIVSENCVKIGAGNNGARGFTLRGGILANGGTWQPDKEFPELFDTPSVIVQGSTITYDPFFMKSLNRFGRLRIASWQVLDQ